MARLPHQGGFLVQRGRVLTFLKRLRLFVIIICMGWLSPLHAQYDAAFNHYWTLQSFYNPAAAGIQGQVNVQGVYAMQMMGYTHAPTTMIISADLPLWMIGPAHGIAVGFINDTEGLFSHKKFYFDYAFHLKLKKGRLSLGVRAGMLSETFDGSGLIFGEGSSTDPAFPSSEAKGTAFDLDAGIRYDGKVWYAGFSAMHTLSPSVKFGESKTNEYQVPITYYLTGGYNIQLKNPLFKIQTSAIVRSDFQYWRGDITARAYYEGPKMKMYLGVGYSPTISASIFLGGNFHGVQVGYGYEFYTGGVGAWQGTHEISLGYTTNLNLFKKGKNRHQSVRLL